MAQMHRLFLKEACRILAVPAPWLERTCNQNLRQCKLLCKSNKKMNLFFDTVYFTASSRDLKIILTIVPFMFPVSDLSVIV